MNHQTNADYAAWLERLVNTCLPKDLQVRIATGQAISAEEFAQFASVVELVGQSKGLSDHAQMIKKLDNLSVGMRQSHDLERTIISRFDDDEKKNIKTDNRRVNSVREAMVILASQTAMNRPQEDLVKICDQVFRLYSKLPDSYDNLDSFIRQVRRVLRTYLD